MKNTEKIIKSIEINNLTKNYKSNKKQKRNVFKNFNISFEEKNIHCILGVSGCGKSTLLRIIAGLENYEKGNIEFNKEIKKNKKLFLSMVLQEKNLLPWLTVYENIKLALNASNLNDYDEKKIDSIFKKHNLLEYKNYYPHELSVGLKQKVSLLKAIIIKPKIMLLDEPFCALDFVSKENIHDIFLKQFENEKFTAILSTHYIEEAVKLGDYIHLLSKNNKYKCFKNPLLKPRDKDPKYYEFLEFIKNEYV